MKQFRENKRSIKILEKELNRSRRNEENLTKELLKLKRGMHHVENAALPKFSFLINHSVCEETRFFKLDISIRCEGITE